MKKHIKMFEAYSNAGDHGYDKIEKFLKETTGKFTFEELEDAIIKIVGSADVTVGVDKKDKTLVFDLNDGTSGHGSVDIDDDGKITLPAKSVYYEDEPEPVDDTNEAFGFGKRSPKFNGPDADQYNDAVNAVLKVLRGMSINEKSWRVFSTKTKECVLGDIKEKLVAANVAMIKKYKSKMIDDLDFVLK